MPAELQAGFDVAEEKLFKNVRAAFGGQLRQAVTGAAPIAKEILEFFYACGVPVLEGYGMTETSTAATISTIDAHKFGTVGRPMAGVQVKIADDGEVLLKGDNIFKGYWHNDAATAGDARRRLAAHRRPRLGRRRRLPVDHRAQEGHHHHRGRQEHHAGQPRERPQAVAVDLPGGHARRPPAVPGRAHHARRGGDPASGPRDQGLPDDIASLAKEPKVHALIQEVLDEVNKKYANVEQIKKFTILDHDLSQETGELTPTLKVKRNVVQDKYADVLDAMYQS